MHAGFAMSTTITKVTAIALQELLSWGSNLIGVIYSLATSEGVLETYTPTGSQAFSQEWMPYGGKTFYARPGGESHPVIFT